MYIITGMTVEINGSARCLIGDVVSTEDLVALVCGTNQRALMVGYSDDSSLLRGKFVEMAPRQKVKVRAGMRFTVTVDSGP